ncbi:MAG: cysteine desulfurase [Ruminococcaceae bacterium]|nr:cysteine desulfurase [Oscillospiraceae bacterium]
MIYLDNSATTELSLSVKQKMIQSLENYGNPSSTHAQGIVARKMIEEARDNVAAALGVSKVNAENLVFTSCGSEANNMALFGSAYAKAKHRANRIITTDSEHPSVENVMKKLEADGFEVIRLRTLGGVIDESQFLSSMNENVLLVSLMMVNNETGAWYDVKKVFSMAKRINPDVVTHCDAVQGFLKVPFSPKAISADLVSISAHKIHGPKGVGALYISPETIKTKRIVPCLLGGGQEGGYRSGTENVIGIVGFGEAAKQGRANFAIDVQRINALRDMCCDMLEGTEVKINAPRGARAPHVLSVTLPGIKSETMLNFLSQREICISAGSACSAHSKHMSTALLGFGLKDFEADTTVRISFSAFNTEDDVKTLVDALLFGVDTLTRIKK